MKIVVDKTTDVVVAIASNTEILSLTNAGMNSVHGFTPAYTTKNAKLVRGVDAPEGAKAGKYFYRGGKFINIAVTEYAPKVSDEDKYAHRED